jgi:ankyrin repeat protein
VTTLAALNVPIDQSNGLHETALTYAVTWRRARVVKTLLALGASPDMPPPPAWSPMYAAQANDVRISKLLVAAGASVERTDEGGRSAAAIASSRGHDALARILSPRARRRNVRGRNEQRRTGIRIKT